MEFESASARLRIDLARGGRLASLQVFGHELLVTAAPDPLHWGSYPMAPWAGRVRHGSFRHAGNGYRLPITAAPHAIHGTVWNRAWTPVSDNRIIIPLGEDWPFPGYAEQCFVLDDHGLTLTLSVHSDAGSFPASIGWHPYFRRQLGAGGDAQLQFDAAAIYVDDEEQIPTGELRPPPPGPWDNCFTKIRREPRLCWPDVLELALSSDLDHWVVYDLLDHALCVEPMSGPPNALNLAPRLVTPDQPLVGNFRLEWKRERNNSRE